MGLTDEVRRFYDAAPCDMPGSMSIAPGWLALAAAPGASPLRPGARILMAGCGTGRGAVGFARALPGAEVVGADLSAASIELARARSQAVDWQVLDLQDSAAVGTLGRFDLVVCHAVADYVPSAERLVRNLAAALTEGGLLLLSANTEHHPRARVLAAWTALGGKLPWRGDAEQRALLAHIGELLGPVPGIASLGALPDTVVAMDLFPPLAHHFPPTKWTELAERAGLYLRGDRRVRELALAPRDVGPLLDLGLRELSALAHLARPAPSAMLLFGRRPPLVDRLSADLGGLAPVADASVPREELPPAEGEWQAARSLTAVDEGVHREVPLSALGMELLRLADGSRSLDALGQSIGRSWEEARGDLFRLVHADLLRLQPPLAP